MVVLTMKCYWTGKSIRSQTNALVMRSGINLSHRMRLDLIKKILHKKIYSSTAFISKYDVGYGYVSIP